MVGRRKLAVSLLLAAPLLLAPLACGDGADRGAPAADDLDRDLDLAFRGDARAPTFEDTAVGGAPVAEPPRTGTAPAQTPQRAAATTPRPVAQPQPARPAELPDATPRPRTVTLTVPTGTAMAIRMNDEVSTDQSRVGDAFTATLTGPIVDADGTVLIPSGATVRGRVTAVAPSTRVGQTATINLAFEAVSFGGRSYPLHASVERADVRQRTRTGAGEQAAKVAAGAAAGAILGRVIGRDTESTVRGAVIGAAAGTAIAMGTADVDAVLPRGAEVLIRLDQPVEITRTIVS